MWCPSSLKSQVVLCEIVPMTAKEASEHIYCPAFMSLVYESALVGITNIILPRFFVNFYQNAVSHLLFFCLFLKHICSPPGIRGRNSSISKFQIQLCINQWFYCFVEIILLFHTVTWKCFMLILFNVRYKIFDLKHGEQHSFFVLYFIFPFELTQWPRQ